MALRYFRGQMSITALEWCLGEDQLSTQDPQTAQLASQPWTESCHFEAEGLFYAHRALEGTSAPERASEGQHSCSPGQGEWVGGPSGPWALGASHL